jgi:hypothetical protein
MHRMAMWKGDWCAPPYIPMAVPVLYMYPPSKHFYIVNGRSAAEIGAMAFPAIAHHLSPAGALRT